MAWEIFKANPFDPKLRTHKINAGRANKAVYAAVIAADLRVVFYVEGESVVTIDIGSQWRLEPLRRREADINSALNRAPEAGTPRQRNRIAISSSCDARYR